jgi:peptide/nickel transport system ATP-binding protein
MKILDIQNLSVVLPRGADRGNAVSNVSLHVNEGEIVCVVGESGSGKSVTAHAVMRLLPKELKANQGAMLLNGENLLDKTAAEMRALRGNRLSMIFQEPMTSLNPVVRLGEQIDEVLRIHTSLSKQARRDKTLLMMSQVNLPDVERIYDSYPHEISGGQRQRVMIAGALILDPVLLIADEPTTALDVTTQAQILKLIKEMQGRKKTGVLFITHDFGVVSEIADRIVVMRAGEVVETGTASQIIDNPQHEYTKMLIAAVPSLTPKKRESVVGETVLEVNALVKTYQRKRLFGTSPPVHAVKAVSFAVKRGETLGLVGESGCGKSTVARAIIRLIEPTSGEILLNKDPVHHLTQKEFRPRRAKMQMIFQDPFRSLNPRRTVGEAIIEGPMNFGVSLDEAKARAYELIKTVGLTEQAFHRYPHQFSGGQRQRLSIARALAMQPDLLIADEPVSALDVSVQADVLRLFEEIKVKFGLAMLFITHDLRVAAQVCDRIAVMQKGEIVEEGATKDIFAAPTHDYTKALFKAVPGRSF